MPKVRILLRQCNIRIPMLSNVKFTYRFEWLRGAWHALGAFFRRAWRKYYVPGDKEDAEVLPLTPIHDADDIAPYANRMRLAMDDFRILNIAVTGRFGAGKSSFLKTYFKDAKVLWISLAPFINTLPHIGGKGYFKNKEQLGRKLEASVLQQMFYTAKAEELPFSRFARICNNGVGTYLLASSIIITALFSVLSIVQPATLWCHVSRLFGVDSDRGFALGVMVGVFPMVAIVAWFCDFVRKARILARVNALCAEIEMGKSSHDLAFNRALDEVIYHFQRIRYEAVIFEDLDRFPDTFIFAKLKEVNQLVNATRDINWHHKPIKFIYAVRDTILGDVERVKFFDYILPIVPSMTSANSKDIFVDCMKRVLKTDILSTEIDGLIRTVAPYIYDRRLLHNICNEYAVFKDRLGDDLSAVKLLAYVLYKNILPEDFEALQEGHGVLSDLIKHKNQLASDEIKKHNSEIKNIQEQLEEAGKDGSFDLMEELDSELEVLKQQNRDVASRELCDWISLGRIDINYVYGLMGLYEVGTPDLTKDWYKRNRANLLFALVSSGCLTEQYKHYIVAYTDSIISDKDHSFVLSCINNIATDETYTIQNLKDVISEIPIISFNKGCILNFSLVREFLINDQVPADKKSVLFANIFNSETPTFGFIDRFLEYYKNDMLVYDGYGKVVKPASWRYARQLVECEDVGDDGKLRQLGVLHRQGVWSLSRFDNVVVNFLASHAKIVTMFSVMGIAVEEIEPFLKNCKIPFKDIDLTESDAIIVLKALVETESYLMCETMVENILIGYGVFDAKRWLEGRGTLMVDANIPGLIARIKDDVKTFLESVYLCSEDKQSEDQKFFDLMLGCKGMSDDLLDRFLEKQSKSVQDITHIDKVDVCIKLAERGLVKYSWKNVIDLFKRAKEEMPSEEKTQVLAVVSKSLEAGHDALMLEPLPAYNDENRQFIEYVVNDEKQSDDLVLYVAKAYKNNVPRYTINSKLPVDRVMALAELGVVAFSKEFYDWLREISVDKVVRFIELNSTEYLANVKSLDFEEEVVEKLLLSKQLDCKFKYDILAEKCDEVCGSDRLKQLVAKDIGIRNFDKYPSKLVCGCFKYLSPVAVQCKVIDAFKFDKKNTRLALGLMIEPYKTLIEYDRNVTLPCSKIVISMLNKLKGLGVVRDFDINGASILVQTEQEIPF